MSKIIQYASRTHLSKVDAQTTAELVKSLWVEPYPMQRILVEGVSGTDEHDLGYTMAEARIPHAGVGLLDVDGTKMPYLGRIVGGILMTEIDRAPRSHVVNISTKVLTARMVITEKGQVFIAERPSSTRKSHSRDEYATELEEIIPIKYAELLIRLSK